MINCLDWVGNVSLRWVVVERTFGPEDGLADDDLLAGDESVGTGGVEVELRHGLGKVLRGRRLRLLEGAGVAGVIPERGVEAALPGPELRYLVQVQLVEDCGGLSSIIEEAWGCHYHLLLVKISLENDIQIL